METSSALFAEKADVEPKRPYSGRRSELETKMDVLRAVMEGCYKPTQIMYKANLSWVALQENLKELQSRGHLSASELGTRKRYEITPTGLAVLRNYETVISAVRGAQIAANY